jgi:hypothetical protein
VGVDSRIEYVRASEVTQKIEPLFVVPLITMVSVEAGGIDHASHEHEEGESCLGEDDDRTIARSVDRAGATKWSPIITSDSGRRETGHWYVPPGRHVYRHRLKGLASKIPFDTRAHYIASHLHPFGESLELIDVTMGESVFKATAANYPHRIAVETITHYSSREGIPIHSQHEYEIVAVYDNTTGQDIDSMAVMYLYLHDSIAKRAAAGGG